MLRKKKSFKINSLLIPVLAAVFLVAFFAYRKYKFDEILMSGQILCSQIMNASMTYYHEHGTYLINDKVSFNKYFPIDTVSNPFFPVFSTYSLKNNKQGITVFGIGKMEGYEISAEFDAGTNKVQPVKNLKTKIVKR